MKNIVLSRKSIFITIISLVIFTYAWHLIKTHHKSAFIVPEAVTVEAEKIKVGSIPIEAQVVGTLAAAKSVQLTPEVTGQVAEIIAQDGTVVRAGTPIIQLDDSVLKAKAESAKANLNYSETNFHRMELLGKKGAVSQQAIDQSLADYKEKKAIEKESRVLAEKMRIVAPFDGKLGKIRVSPGEHVGVGQQLVSLTDTENLRVEFNVSEKYLANLKIGQQVTITTTAYPGKEFFGKVSYIAPTINTEDRTISIYADVPNQDNRLTSGLFVHVTQLLGNDDNVLLIPSVSLVATIDGQQVYKIVDGKAVSVPVKIGQRTENQVQVTEGLVLNDLVVVAGQHKIKDGMPVKVKLRV